MGSRSKINLAYIAGFLDGDGSLMLQIKKRKDGKLKRRFMRGWSPAVIIFIRPWKKAMGQRG